MTTNPRGRPMASVPDIGEWWGYRRPVTPGRREGYTLRIRPGHHRFAAGHRVRLRLSGGSSDTLVPVEEAVEVVIHGGATLTLPGFAAPDPDQTEEPRTGDR